jgi:hypothetical protein
MIEPGALLGAHFDRIAAPEVESIGSGMTVRGSGRKTVLIWSWAAKNLWACLGKLNRPMIFSGLRVGLYDPSIRLFMPLRVR